MLVREALVTLLNLSELIAAKMDEPISHVQGWRNVQIATLVAKFYSHMINVDWLPSRLQEQDPDWEPALGLGLAH